MKNSPLWRDLLALTLFLALLFGAFLGSRPFMTPDEGRYAEIPREMVESGDYVTPRLNYIKYFEKPPFVYWQEAAAIKVAGLNEWSLRSINALIALFTCLAAYLAGRQLYDRRTGILACAMLATSLLYFGLAHFIIPDVPLTFWLTSCLLLFIVGTGVSESRQRRYYFWGMFACAAMAVLTKGLVGIIFPGMVVFLWLCLTNNWRQLKTYSLISGTLVFLLVAAPWHTLVQMKNPEFFQFYFLDQQFLRYLTDYAARDKPIWFFPLTTLAGFFPWICCVIVIPIHALFKRYTTTRWARVAQLWKERHQHAVTMFFTIWAVSIFIFFWCSKSQLISYALPIMPPLALLTARHVAACWQNKRNAALNIAFWLIAVLGTLASIAVYIAIATLDDSHLFLYGGASLLLLSALSSAFCYWRRGVAAGITCLVLSMSAFLISLNLNYAQMDGRSLKPLTTILLPQLQADTQVFSYHDYFQDLPVYLQRRINVVGIKGELEFGTNQEDTSVWMIDDATFWKRWRSGKRMFMIAKREDYQALKTQNAAKSSYVVAETRKHVLLTNRPLQ
jgi:4-amino-4-deoxy-L-arabinose transferase-like glycosyltransferase